MSEPLRIGLVVEGPTDRIVIEAAVRAVLGERSFIMTQLQPEDSEAFGANGGGWPGVYKWCRQNANHYGGRISENAMLGRFHLVIIHLDADVADVTYESGNITPDPTDLPLPCAKACPPPSATTDALRDVALSWCGILELPQTLVICMPSKSTEAWVAASLFPDDSYVQRGASFECFENPAGRLGQQPKKRRIQKRVPDYRAQGTALTREWPRLSGPIGLEQAARFDSDLRAAIPN